MKKAGQLLAVLTAASVLLSGCEKLKDVTTTSVYVSKNGVVTEAIVEDYSKDDDYTEDELKVFVEDDIKKFTEERGDADSVKLEKCQIKEDKVEIRMEYGDYQSYADYHGAEFFAGTLDEAEEAGYDFSASFVDSKGNEVSVEDAVKGVKHVRVIVCEEPLEIVTEDPVLCVSGTAAISLPQILRSSFSFKSRRFFSSYQIFPPVTLPFFPSNPIAALINVDLPLPLSPAIPKISPFSAEKLTFLITGLPL